MQSRSILPEKTKVIVVIIIINVVIMMLIDEFNCETLDQYLSMGHNPSGNNIQWPNKEIKNEIMKKGKFDPRDILPTRFQFHDDNVYFVIPKYRQGVPFSLGRMSIKDSDRINPKIYPYPDWDLHDESSYESIKNAVDIFLDQNEILWVLDVGIVNTLHDPKVAGMPRVIGIEADCAKVRYTVNLEPLICGKSRLQFVVAEVTGDKTALYISDAGTRSIIVFDVTSGKGFRVVLPAAVDKDSPKKDVLYLILAYKGNGEPGLFFSYLGSRSFYMVKTDNFRLGQTRGSVVPLGMKPAKMVFLGTDNGKNIFFRFQGGNTVYLWNTEKSFHRRNFVIVEKPKYCRMATHIVTGYRSLMWVLESNFQDYISGQVCCLGASAVIHPLIKYCEDKNAFENESNKEITEKYNNKFGKKD